MLLAAVERTEGLHWDSVAAEVGRSEAACFFHYQHCLNQNIAKTHFTEEADRMLAGAAIECGLCNWTLVACLMGDGYVYKQCKNRYLLLLSQAQSPLTHAENEKLALAVRVFGYSWRSCARHFPGRSGRDLAERYRP